MRSHGTLCVEMQHIAQEHMKYMEQIIIGVTYNQRSHIFHVLYVYTNNEITHIAQETHEVHGTNSYIILFTTLQSLG